MATNFVNTFKNKEINIPIIQRDYIQGYDINIVKSFINSLLSALENNNINKCDLNYIYGEEKDNIFIPIDGQQRLTTLWLLHLYLGGSRVSSKLTYKSRDYADRFCETLIINIDSCLVHKHENIKEHIENAPWFLESWKEDHSVCAMLLTLKEIEAQTKNMNKDYKEKLWERLNSTDCPIVFSFKSTEDLGKDIYIKMNGRGRKLSNFENLKSWMDKRIQDLNFDEDWIKSWKDNIDNTWINFFWERSDHKVDVLDRIMSRFFSNMLYVYWKKKDYCLVNDPDREFVLSYIWGMTKSSTNKELSDAILYQLRIIGHEYPLYFFDKINLFEKGYFELVFKTLEGLINHQSEINSFSGENITEGIVFTDSQKEEYLLFNMIMKPGDADRNGVSYKKLAYCNALSIYVSDKTKDKKTSLFDWMYLMRNLIENSDKLNDNGISQLLKDIDVHYRNCIRTPFEDYAISKYNENTHWKEEAQKAAVIKSGKDNMIKKMRQLENRNFFMGKISCLFDLIGEYKETQDYQNLFIGYIAILCSLFTGEKAIYKENSKCLLHRSMLCLNDYIYGIYHSGGRSWNFLKDKDSWQRFVKDRQNIKKEGVLKGSLDSLISVLYKEKAYSADEIKICMKKIINEANVCDWRSLFIKNDCVWDELMIKGKGYGVLYGENPYNIWLSRSTECFEKSRHVDLRVCILHHDMNELIRNKNGWIPKIYEHDNSCSFYDKDYLHLNIWYDWKYATENKTESAYMLDLKRYTGENSNRLLKEQLEKFKNIDEIEERDGCFYLKKCMSKENIIKLTQRILERY